MHEEISGAKEKATTAPILTIPNENKGSTLYYDASKQRLDVGLMQGKKVIAYASC